MTFETLRAPSSRSNSLFKRENVFYRVHSKPLKSILYVIFINKCRCFSNRICHPAGVAPTASQPRAHLTVPMRVFLTASRQQMKYSRYIYAPPVMLHHRKEGGCGLTKSL